MYVEFITYYLMVKMVIIILIIIITWQGSREVKCSDWFFLGFDFALCTVSKERVISCIFCVGP